MLVDHFDGRAAAQDIGRIHASILSESSRTQRLPICIAMLDGRPPRSFGFIRAPPYRGQNDRWNEYYDFAASAATTVSASTAQRSDFTGPSGHCQHPLAIFSRAWQNDRQASYRPHSRADRQATGQRNANARLSDGAIRSDGQTRHGTELLAASGRGQHAMREARMARHDRHCDRLGAAHHPAIARLRATSAPPWASGGAAPIASVILTHGPLCCRRLSWRAGHRMWNFVLPP